jgi:hypothetical protein
LKELVHGHTYVSVDYEPGILQWASTEYYDDNVKKIQLPFHQVHYYMYIILLCRLLSLCFSRLSTTGNPTQETSKRDKEMPGEEPTFYLNPSWPSQLAK